MDEWRSESPKRRQKQTRATGRAEGTVAIAALARLHPTLLTAAAALRMHGCGAHGQPPPALSVRRGPGPCLFSCSSQTMGRHWCAQPCLKLVRSAGQATAGRGAAKALLSKPAAMPAHSGEKKAPLVNTRPLLVPALLTYACCSSCKVSPVGLGLQRVMGWCLGSSRSKQGQASTGKTGPGSTGAGGGGGSRFKQGRGACSQGEMRRVQGTAQADCESGARQASACWVAALLEESGASRGGEDTRRGG